MRRLLNFLLLITFQFCYLEWPPNYSLFIYQCELEIIQKTDNLLTNLLHPVILAGLIAQIILLIGSFYPKLNNKVNALGVFLLFLLVLLFFIVSIFSRNYKIAISTLPYFIVTIIYIVNYRKQKLI